MPILQHANFIAETAFIKTAATSFVNAARRMDITHFEAHPTALALHDCFARFGEALKALVDMADDVNHDHPLLPDLYGPGLDMARFDALWDEDEQRVEPPAGVPAAEQDNERVGEVNQEGDKAQQAEAEHDEQAAVQHVDEVQHDAPDDHQQDRVQHDSGQASEQGKHGSQQGQHVDQTQPVDQDVHLQHALDSDSQHDLFSDDSSDDDEATRRAKAKAAAERRASRRRARRARSPSFLQTAKRRRTSEPHRPVAGESCALFALNAWWPATVVRTADDLVTVRDSDEAEHTVPRARIIFLMCKDDHLRIKDAKLGLYHAPAGRQTLNVDLRQLGPHLRSLLRDRVQSANWRTDLFFRLEAYSWRRERMEALFSFGNMTAGDIRGLERALEDWLPFELERLNGQYRVAALSPIEQSEFIHLVLLPEAVIASRAVADAGPAGRGVKLSSEALGSAQEALAAETAVSEYLCILDTMWTLKAALLVDESE